MEYEAVIGLEVHAELLTDSKIFCSCASKFGGAPNTHCCPGCLAMPGTLPILNKHAVELGIKAALALNCEILPYSRFDRKNYFYPDLPKAYQISQNDFPLAVNGYINIETEQGIKKIGIKRAHLEEDAGKLIHSEHGDYSLVDFNRSGAPLIEIVSEPDLNTPREAWLYLTKLKSILEYTEVSDCKMQEGSLRCDANVSIRAKGSEKLGTKTELKNMNSFRAIERALEYEIERQKRVLEKGEEVIQETRRWDDARGITITMRTKEEAADYRYFPDPDLPPIVIEKDFIEEVRSKIPELSHERKERYIREFGLPEYDAGVLTDSKKLSDFFEECVNKYPDAKKVSNWIMVELLAILNAEGKEIEDISLTPDNLVKMLNMIDKGTISGKIAKTVFREMLDTGKDPSKIVEEKGLVQLSDEDELEKIVDIVLNENQQSVDDYKNGKDRAFGFLVGQVMKATRGKANPKIVNKLLREKIDG